MILDEKDLIIKDHLSANFDKKLLALSARYLQLIYANHMFFSIENRVTKERLGFSTRTDWQQYYIGKKLIDHCPLYAATVYYPMKYKQDSFFFLWNKIIPDGKKQKEIVYLRKEVGIANGISLTKRFGNYQAMLGIGTEPNEHELERKYISLMPTIITLFAQASDLQNHFKESVEC
ncbi:MAG: hypothetical protein AB7V32_04240 [Candidatus Berkiella sp.]